jgi:hypothetical protein
MSTSGRDTKDRVCVRFKQKIGIAKFSCGRNLTKRLLFFHKFHVGFQPYFFNSLLPSEGTFNLLASFLQSGVRLPPGVSQNILGGTPRHLTSIKSKHRNRFNLKPALILALTKILLRIEALACQKQA